MRGNLGPTVVRLDEPRYPLHMNLRVGTVMSMLGTVTGRVFSAFLPDAMVRAMVAGEHERVIGARTPTGLSLPPGGLAWLDSPEIRQALGLGPIFQPAGQLGQTVSIRQAEFEIEQHAIGNQASHADGTFRAAA